MHYLTNEGRKKKEKRISYWQWGKWREQGSKAYAEADSARTHCDEAERWGRFLRSALDVSGCGQRCTLHGLQLRQQRTRNGRPDEKTGTGKESTMERWEKWIWTWKNREKTILSCWCYARRWSGVRHRSMQIILMQNMSPVCEMWVSEWSENLTSVYTRQELFQTGGIID